MFEGSCEARSTLSSAAWKLWNEVLAAQWLESHSEKVAGLTPGRVWLSAMLEDGLCFLAKTAAITYVFLNLLM